MSVTKEELAYISGFLDGDGCVMLQLVARAGYKLGYQIRASIVFYQKLKHKDFLVWLKSELKYGYIRERNDGMCEYTIVGVVPVTNILKLLKPYLKLKNKQAKLALSILLKMPKKGRNINPKLLLLLAKEVDKFVDLNYSKKRTNTSEKIEEFYKSHNISLSRRD